MSVLQKLAAEEAGTARLGQQTAAAAAELAAWLSADLAPAAREQRLERAARSLLRSS